MGYARRLDQISSFVVYLPTTEEILDFDMVNSVIPPIYPGLLEVNINVHLDY